MAFLLLFIGLPLVEIFLLVEVGEEIGFLPNLALVLGTGFLGGSLARQQGAGVLARMQAEAAAGRAPNRSALEAVVIQMSGVLLFVPGFLTDAVGLLGLFPPTRALIISWFERSVVRAMKEGRVVMGGRGGPGGGMFFSGRLGGRPPADTGASSSNPLGRVRDDFGGIRDATVVAEKDGPAHRVEDESGERSESTRENRDVE